ncbi:MAG TPA: mannose-1-phosphate guanylyltransferase/mannose-6-phosphate isomerase [Beijerinckiaceae bacterium]|nr:mannose-1-phosphate guanylyltransferase/mannose-6-phosphate isomerase [Beijerinckiaceae bacterium]
MSSSSAITPVVLCGGTGTRLWPVSREKTPKQFAPLIGSRSTFQLTVERVSSALFRRPCVITNNDARFVVAEQLRETGRDAEIVLEPHRRDSAAAIAAAAVLAARRDPQAILLALPADHLIDDADAFARACEAALRAVDQGLIMTFGIRPDRPATAFGYIQAGDAVGDGAGFRVSQFVEKPDAATAARYIDQGYLWNSGCFLFRADVMLREIAQFAPPLLAAIQEAVAAAKTDLDFLRLDADAFGRAPRISIDHAVMEHTTQAGVVPVSFRWSDIGSWGALWDVLQRDENGNAVQGDARLTSVRNSLVFSDDMLTAVAGLEDVVVVSTRDAVLVTSRRSDQDVKALVESLKAEGRNEADEHLRVHRPWGWYQRVDIGHRFQVKRICVQPGGRLSLQRHAHRAEHWVVVTGSAEVTIGDRVVVLHENESAYVPIGCSHRLVNPGRIPLEIIEVQVGSYTGEDDIVRLEDVYNRP